MRTARVAVEASFAIFLLTALAGCGDGGATANTPPTTPAPTPSPTPAPTPTPTPTPSVVITTRSLAVSATDIGVPLTNGIGVYAADVPISVHTEDGQLYVVRWTSSPTKQSLSTSVGGMTLAGKGNHLLVAYVHLASNQMRLIESTDAGLTWSTAHSLGERPAGPALPTACVYDAAGQRKRVVAWSHQPSESEGPLKLALHDGTSWQPVVNHAAIPSSGAALYCADDAAPEIVWRDHRLFTSGGPVVLYQASIDAAGGLSGAHQVLQSAYDPSYCGHGTYRYTGFHDAINEAHIGRSTDGGVTFNDVDADGGSSGVQSFDASGKFVSLSCSASLIAATWGDWPTKQEAADRATTRKLGMTLSNDNGQTWISARPAGESENLGPATVFVGGSTAYVMWKAPGAIHLARVAFN